MTARFLSAGGVRHSGQYPAGGAPPRGGGGPFWGKKKKKNQKKTWGKIYPVMAVPMNLGSRLQMRGLARRWSTADRFFWGGGGAGGNAGTDGRGPAFFCPLASSGAQGDGGMGIITPATGKGSFEGCRDDLVLLERRIATFAAQTPGGDVS